MDRLLHTLTDELILLLQHNMTLAKAFELLESNIDDPKKLLLLNCMRKIAEENDNAQIIVIPENKNSLPLAQEKTATIKHA